MKTIFKRLGTITERYSGINEMNIDVLFVSHTYVRIYDKSKQCNNDYIVDKVMIDCTEKNPIQIVYLKDV